MELNENIAKRKFIITMQLLANATDYKSFQAKWIHHFKELYVRSTSQMMPSNPKGNGLPAGSDSTDN